MQSFLIVSSDAKKQEECAHALCRKHKIDPFDITIIEEVGETTGISEIRALQKGLFLKPLKSTTKAVVLKHAEKLTIAAQNAMLKILEEPPNNTLIILTVSQRDILLPTILSRCTIIELKNNMYELSKKETTEYIKMLSSLLGSGVGKKLKVAQDLAKDKNEAIKWLEAMIILIRQQLLSHYNNTYHYNSEFKELSGSDYYVILKVFQQTHMVLSTTNVNPRFALENLFLSIS